ncbi:hypothetical protein GGTG_05197 [Gaeumannomyces tritici R3-111a-1]|uniref:Uncharacterized protein n=1 Tax=Gaeumannomyces tritici (strain R3-111a-1) TaxID=644352 RepID=J3NV84_GAET3|nr:hypothetical protein GGTG_05197 [Gaeumannomyces tritici R3-111a-1]EJT75260.1 hypothetical protein GGTG_05197 [Gaeumannomyces tritici R3-111a-1]
MRKNEDEIANPQEREGRWREMDVGGRGAVGVEGRAAAGPDQVGRSRRAALSVFNRRRPGGPSARGPRAARVSCGCVLWWSTGIETEQRGGGA